MESYLFCYAENESKQHLEFRNSGELTIWEDDSGPQCGSAPKGNDTSYTWWFSSDSPNQQYLAYLFSADATGTVYLGMQSPPDPAHHAIYNYTVPFDGVIDDVRIYRRALDPAEIDEIYRAGAAAVHLRFDDAPGSDSFANAVNLSAAGNGSCSGDACPTAGVAGRDNQAALFKGTAGDGVGDHVDVAVDLSETAYGVSFWFQTDCAGCGIYQVSNGTPDVATAQDRQVFLIGGHVCIKDKVEMAPICTAGSGYADGRWHHVIHTFGTGIGVQKLYVDGSPQTTGSVEASNFNGTRVNVGYSEDATTKYFNGRLDDLRVFKGALSDWNVQTLYQAPPRFQLHLDEPEGVISFSDAGAGNDGTCDGDGDACPTAGVKGQLGLAVKLDGVDDYLQVTDSNDLDQSTFTVGSWVLPTTIKNTWQPIIVKGKNYRLRDFQTGLMSPCRAR